MDINFKKDLLALTNYTIFGLAVIIIILIICFFMRQENFVGAFKKDSLSVRQWLCEWKLMQRKGPGSALTPQESADCRVRALGLSEQDTDQLLCQYNTWIRQIQATGNHNYIVSPQEIAICERVNGPLSKATSMGKEWVPDKLF